MTELFKIIVTENVTNLIVVCDCIYVLAQCMLLLLDGIISNWHLNLTCKNCCPRLWGACEVKERVVVWDWLACGLELSTQKMQFWAIYMLYVKV